MKNIEMDKSASPICDCNDDKINEKPDTNVDDNDLINAVDGNCNNEDEEDVLTLHEIVQEEAYLEQQATAVLGAVDENKCTYENGYMPRQPLYACVTCSGPDEVGGVCLACSLHCHSDHELIELYTKREFRCDCGNAKFSADFHCQLYPTKELNDKNKYNHNFRGLYCSCNGRYPDPDDDIQDEMIQCIVCEDWFHKRHLSASVPSEFNEIVCATCAKSFSFLPYYAESFGLTAEVNDRSLIQKEHSIPDGNATKIVDALTTHVTTTLTKPDVQECLLHELRGKKANENQSMEHSPLYFSEDWRKKLCRCQDCLKMYVELQCEFLLDPNDTIDCYEELSKQKSSENTAAVDEKIKQFLGGVDRVQMIEMVHGYNELKTGLTMYLEKFATSGEVVTARHITEFFSELHSNKRQKTT